MHPQSSFPADRATAAAYLAALIDGEGTVRARMDPPNHQQRYIRIGNTEPAIIAAAVRCCDMLGLRHRIYTEPARQGNDGHMRRTIDVLNIGDQHSLRVILHEVPIQSPGKLARLRQLVDSYVESQHRRAGLARAAQIRSDPAMLAELVARPRDPKTGRLLPRRK